MTFVKLFWCDFIIINFWDFMMCFRDVDFLSPALYLNRENNAFCMALATKVVPFAYMLRGNPAREIFVHS